MCEANSALQKCSSGQLEGQVRAVAQQLAEEADIPWDAYSEMHGVEVRRTLIVTDPLAKKSNFRTHWCVLEQYYSLIATRKSCHCVDYYSSGHHKGTEENSQTSELSHP